MSRMGRGLFARFSIVADRLSDRLSRSARLFLVGLVIACGVEVAVDWSSTLGEINVLRGALEQRGENYVDILRRAAAAPLAAYDALALDELMHGLFDDEDIVYVRFTDRLGNTLADRLRGDYGAAFARARGRDFRDHYRHQMDRDCDGLLRDAAGLRARMAQSRHRDFIQLFTDAEDRLLERLTAPAPVPAMPQVLYQDRLYDEARRLDHTLTYAIGAVPGGEGDAEGVVLVAFSQERVNRAVRGKLLKGLAVTLFFVALILVQNLLGRRAKLRLLDLEAALAAARAAIRSATLPLPAWPGGDAGVGFAQAERLGGTVYDLACDGEGTLELFLAVPEGRGVDVAFAAVVLCDVHRRQRRGVAPAEHVAALLDDYAVAPLGRPLDLLFLRLGSDGRVDGVVAGLQPPAVAYAGDAGVTVRPLALGEALPLRSPRLGAPLTPFSGVVDGALVIYDDGLPPAAARRLGHADALAALAAAVGRGQSAGDAAAAVVELARRRYKSRASDDLFAFVAVPRRHPPA